MATEAEGQSLSELERQAERTRAGLIQTVDELHDRVSPQAIKQEMRAYARGASQDLMHNLERRARENPLQTVAVAAGLAYPAWRFIANIPAPILLIGAGLALSQVGARSAKDLEKTRLIEFGRHAVDRRARRGLGKPETFKFLGFTHICGQSRRGKFLLKRRTRRDRMRAKLTEIKEELRRRMHQPIPEQGQWLLPDSACGREIETLQSRRARSAATGAAGVSCVLR